jgi:hypothetical protein
MYIVEPPYKLIGHQPFRGYIKQIEFPVMEHGKNLAGFLTFQGRVIKGRPYTAGLERIHLVLHKGDER